MAGADLPMQVTPEEWADMCSLSDMFTCTGPCAHQHARALLAYDSVCKFCFYKQRVELLQLCVTFLESAQPLDELRQELLFYGGQSSETLAFPANRQTARHTSMTTDSRGINFSFLLKVPALDNLMALECRCAALARNGLQSERLAYVCAKIDELMNDEHALANPRQSSMDELLLFVYRHNSPHKNAKQYHYERLLAHECGVNPSMLISTRSPTSAIMRARQNNK